MRTYAVLIFMFAVILYAQRDWFISLCAVIVFTALKEYPGLPNPLDARGINHWSVMVLGVVAGWLSWRIAARPRWIIPRGWLIVIGLYLLMESVAIARLCVNLDVFKERAALVNPGYAYYNIQAVLVDMVYGPTRFMLLGLLLFDGARTRRRLLFGLGAVLAAVLIYAWVVNKTIPLSGLGGGGMQFRLRISKWTGRNPNDLARLFAATFWIGLAFWQLRLGSKKLRLAALAAVVPILIALGHTLSRGGYSGFVGAGLAVGLVTRSWRTLACLATVILAVVLFVPSVTDRLLVGVDTSGMGEHDMAEVGAGRWNVIWPAAIRGIEDSPLIGHGSHGYVLSPAMLESIAMGGGEIHPHNAYLETLLDHGIVGVPARLGPFIYVLVAGVFLVCRRRDPILRFAGVTAVAWVSATLVMGLTGQQWGFCENLFTFWCVAGLVVRAVTLPDCALRGRTTGEPGCADASRASPERSVSRMRHSVSGSSAWQ